MNGVLKSAFSVKNVFAAALVALCFGAFGVSSASAQIVPPDIGVDAAAVVAAIGVALTAIVGAAFAMLIAMITFRFLWKVTKRGTN